MSDFQEQLAHLRRRIAKIDRKYAKPKPAPRPAPAPSSDPPEDCCPGRKSQPSTAGHFETEKLYERHRRHGSIGHRRSGRPSARLAASHFERRDSRRSPPGKWCFLDTETTGLAGGSGTYAFLIGVGRITPDGFRVRQFFMRDFGEEASLLSALTEHLKQFEVLITYNGRTFDQPLLETRFRMVRQRPPFSSLAHLDLLFGARRLWKLRFDSCRLVDLENQILGVERQGDLPGELIPYFYFEYLRTHEIFPPGADFPSQRDRHSDAGLSHRDRAAGFSSARPGPVRAWSGNGGLSTLVAASRSARRTRWRCSARPSIKDCRTI